MKNLTFPTDLNSILNRVESIDPVAYERTRNYNDGAVTYLSAYISRGVISTRFVCESLMKRGFQPKKIYKMIQELAWRDYWQQIWIAQGKAIDEDLKHAQSQVEHHQIPTALIQAQTGIHALDEAIAQFYETGYLHNHVRMYLAALACNVGHSHWKLPAQWIYYHLLDGDWASNALSWQWVAGTTRTKKYIANQQNINRYLKSDQQGTFLDVDYDVLETMKTPEVLTEIQLPNLNYSLPESDTLTIDPSLPTLIYNYYNLDPFWKKDLRANRIFLLEPPLFKQYPVSPKCLEFSLSLSKNIEGIQVYVAEFSELKSKLSADIYYKEHPLNQSYEGLREPRDWMTSIKGEFSSFFAFWKKASKELSL